MNELVNLVAADGTVLYSNILRSQADNYTDAHLQIVIVVVFNLAGDVLVHERAQTKRVNPGDIDHVCGGVMAVEASEEAARRECLEETGVRLQTVREVRTGVNEYGRYCRLYVGTTHDVPSDELDTSEVAWARFMPVAELRQKHATRELTFVEGFFDDLDLALAH